MSPVDRIFFHLVGYLHGRSGSVAFARTKVVLRAAAAGLVAPARRALCRTGSPRLRVLEDIVQIEFFWTPKQNQLGGQGAWVSQLIAGLQLESV
jgi:hypothetical protein